MSYGNPVLLSHLLFQYQASVYLITSSFTFSTTSPEEADEIKGMGESKTASVTQCPGQSKSLVD